MDLQKFYTGQAFDAYEYFGAHIGNDGVTFRTYAPRASSVTVTGDFNNWSETPLIQHYQSGIWSVVLENAKPDHMYKYRIYSHTGCQEHCDPYGFGMEVRPGACSVIRDLKEYTFNDEAWIQNRSKDGPMNIYELHLGSWRKKGSEWYSYDEVAEPLIEYLTKHNYNYVEFMPISEHPFDGSWGYQNTGFFAPTSRYGTACQLMALIDRLHAAGIGVILDFVPVHFAVDAYGLKNYDGTALYEYPHPDVGESEWGSINFNHSRGETASFLQSAANYWLKEYHFDGLRMDAVSRLIYWQGDEKRGENGMTLNFMKIMNKGLHALHPTAIIIAEDSTSYPGVTRSVDEGGLGFDYKWDLGWMHDTLEYLSCPPHDRAFKSGLINFSIIYAWNERYILPFSHDEVVHGKKTIVNKLWGSCDDKFSQARALYLYMLTHPGKKLNFMGNELAMFREWDENREADWELMKIPAHKAFLRYITELNSVYLKTPALWEHDALPEGFKWLDCGNTNPCLFSYKRIGNESEALVLLNFSDKSLPIQSLPEGFVLVLHTDWVEYGGKTIRAKPAQTLPPYAGILLTK